MRTKGAARAGLGAAVATVAVAAVAICGCGHMEMHQVVLRVPSGAGSHDAELYMGDTAPRRPYYEMALLQAIGYGSDANLGDVTDALRERARYLGCDALIHTHVDQGYSMAHGFGVCVKWASVAPAPAPAEPPVTPRPAPAEPPVTPRPAPADEPTNTVDAGSDSGEVGF